MRVGVAVVTCGLFALTGCSGAVSSWIDEAGSQASQSTNARLTGTVHGGQQPLAGAHVYLLAAAAGASKAGQAAYGGAGITASSANASVSLLTSAANTTPDTSGTATDGDYFVTTDSAGNFSITGDYTCTAGQQVYLYALGGDAGAGMNPSAGLMAVLGNCPAGGNFLSGSTPIPTVNVNEVSTVAAAYAMAGFATDAVHVGSSGTSLAQTGIANAFANAGNLVNVSKGTALATTPASNGTVPQSTINTIANILASCVNSSGPASSSCLTLFANAVSAGPNATTPTDTATAAINIAHNPGSNIAALYNLSVPAPPFTPTLAQQPNDFTVGLQFTGGGLYFPVSLAIDAAGSVWITSGGDMSISKFSSAGAALSPSTGFTGGGLSDSGKIAIDSDGNAWVTNPTVSSNSISEFSSSGGPLSPSTGYTGGGLVYPIPIAIDASGDIWTANYETSASKFSNTGVALSPAGGYTGGGLYNSFSLAIDGSGNAWIANDLNPGSVSKFSSAGVPLSPSSGFTGGGLNSSGPPSIAIDASGNAWVTSSTPLGIVSKFSNAGAPLSPASGYTGGGLDSPISVAIDGAGNAWIANDYVSFGPTDSAAGSISEFSSTGVALSPAAGYTSGGLQLPQAIAIDGSGNVWVTNNHSSSVSEFIGIAAPVITPLCAGLPAVPTSDGSSKLGTRP